MTWEVIEAAPPAAPDWEPKGADDMNLEIERTRFLRRALMADGVVSGLSGVPLVLAPSLVASLIGLTSAVPVAVVGLALVVYGLALVRNARREMPRREEVVM